MPPAKTTTLKVPGATLYYEVRGSGQVLLLICGGIYDADTYAALAQQLAHRYTVVTYDRRGNSRSPLDGPPERQRMEVHADDASRLLSAVAGTGNEAAYVFGNSSGGQIGLELAARYPEQVRTLIAHEPPIFEMLPDRAYWRTLIQGVEEAFRSQGAGAAMQALGAGFGGADAADPPPPPAAPAAPDPETAQAMDSHLAEVNRAMAKNMETFIGYEVPPFATWVPDIAALQASTIPVVAAVGAETSPREPMYRAALVLAERLGTQPVVFPGDHGGFAVPSEAFAAALHEVLSTS
jgi:pimeloyl-ACP methyl ester carboxylesterase